MDDQTFDNAEAKMPLSRLNERTRPAPAEMLARIDAVRERIRKRSRGLAIRAAGESWREFIEAGHRL